MTAFLGPTLVAIAGVRGGARATAPAFRKVAIPSPTYSEPSHLPGKIYEQWFRLSSLVRFFVSGNLGNICFFFIERSIFQYISNLDTVPEIVENYQETFSFFAGYLLQIVSQHWLHALLVYGLDTINTREKYFKTLIGQFYAYGMALFGSTFLNLFLIKSGVDKTLAFFSTMMIFACVNYYLIGFLTKRALKSAEPEPQPRGIRAFQGRATKDSIGRGKPNKKDGSLRRIRRGGGFGNTWTGPSFVGPNSIHQMVLDIDDGVNVDAVNAEL